MAQRPDYAVKTVVAAEGEGRDRWREIGAGFRNEESGNITVFLDALPVSGKIVLLPPKQQQGGK